MTEDASFADRYGPWALVAGASEGIGAAFAGVMAQRGLNVVLLARRQRVLDQVSSSIRAATGVDTKAVAVDLAEPDAMTKILEATAGLDIGMLMYGAGADPNYDRFLDQPVEHALTMVQRNCTTPLLLCHHFAAPMVARGKGGIVLLSSGAGFAGAPNMVAYGASKAFDMVMAESLWAELHAGTVSTCSPRSSGYRHPGAPSPADTPWHGVRSGWHDADPRCGQRGRSRGRRARQPDQRPHRCSWVSVSATAPKCCGG